MSDSNKGIAQYLTLHINPTILVFNIETSRKLIYVPETTNTKNLISKTLKKNIKTYNLKREQITVINNTHAFVAA
jgi:hypothetical protein